MAVPRSKKLAHLSGGAALLHLASGLTFFLLWLLKTKDDGGRRDLVYPLYAGYSFWNTSAPHFESYTGCDPPRALRFSEGMTVSPVWKDSGVELSLHWLVTSFFFLSAAFQGFAAFRFYPSGGDRSKGDRYRIVEDGEEADHRDAPSPAQTLRAGELTDIFLREARDSSSRSLRSRARSPAARPPLVDRGRDRALPGPRAPPNPGAIKFYEYAISASVMIVAIALQLGIFGAQVLLLLAVLTAATMLCGLVAETLDEGPALGTEPSAPSRSPRYALAPRVRATDVLTNLAPRAEGPRAAEPPGPPSDAPAASDDADGAFWQRLAENRGETMKRAAWRAHCVGWLAQAAVFVVLLQQFHGSQAPFTCETEARSAPEFVWFIVYLELLLFASFGFVQLVKLRGRIDATQAEMSYIVLSFVSKSLLGWLVYTGNFAG